MNVVETERTRNCPQCNLACDADVAECPRCRIVFAKHARADQRREQARHEAASLGGGAALERMAEVDGLLVRQQVERLELFTGFELTNNYVVLDALGHALFHAGEESHVLARMFLKNMRPFTLHVAAHDGRPVLTFRRPFRFYFHELDIHETNGRKLGSLRRRWSLVNRRYTLSDAVHGREYEIFGPLLKPWTFRVLRDGTELGAIRKKWSGALRELFTDADFFGVEFPRDLDIRSKALFLGAVFLIDFLHFEKHDND